MKTIKKINIALLILLLLTSCNKEEPPNTKKGEENVKIIKNVLKTYNNFKGTKLSNLTNKKPNFVDGISYDFDQSDLEIIKQIKKVKKGNFIKAKINGEDLGFGYLVTSSKDGNPINSSYIKIKTESIKNKDFLENNTIKINGEINIEREVNNISDLGNQRKIDKLNFSLYSEEGSKNLFSKIKKLKQSNNTENKISATFLESFIGQYDNAIKDRDKLCNTIIGEEKKIYCKKQNLIINSFRPVDEKGKIIKDTTISIDGQEENKMGATTKLNIYNNFVHRVKISAKGYTDFYEKIVFTDKGFDKVQISPKLIKSEKNIILKDNKEQIVQTKNFKFKVKKENFVNANGTEVNGDIEVHFFDLGQSNGDFNNVNLDSFDKDNGSYLGQSMVTFGMPLIKAYNNGKELKILGVPTFGKIQNGWKNPGLDLNNVPKNKFLNSKELEKYKIPLFRTLNRRSGVRYTTNMKILDNEGNYEVILK